MPAPHPPEFRQRAVDLARRREQPVADIAASLKISESCLRNWMAQADADDGVEASGGGERLSSKERAELAELRKDKKRLEVENEILKRAALDSTGQRNSAASLSAGVSKFNVLRGLVFNRWATASSSRCV